MNFMTGTLTIAML